MNTFRSDEVEIPLKLVVAIVAAAVIGFSLPFLLNSEGKKEQVYSKSPVEVPAAKKVVEILEPAKEEVVVSDYPEGFDIEFENTNFNFNLEKMKLGVRSVASEGGHAPMLVWPKNYEGDVEIQIYDFYNRDSVVLSKTIDQENYFEWDEALPGEYMVKLAHQGKVFDERYMQVFVNPPEVTCLKMTSQPSICINAHKAVELYRIKITKDAQGGQLVKQFLTKHKKIALPITEYGRYYIWLTSFSKSKKRVSEVSKPIRIEHAQDSETILDL